MKQFISKQQTNIKISLILLCLLHIPISAYSKLEIPNIFSDNMVLQQNSSVRIWGKANAKSIIEIEVGWNKESLIIKADNEGMWETSIKTVAAGRRSYSIVIRSESESKIINNILLGEVWICSGQSNMSMPLKGFPSQPVSGALDAVIESASYDDIRMFTSDLAFSQTEEFDVGGSWKPASLNSTPNFSAIGYFYAMELRKVLQVPIGMINISWGGSTVQAWMSLELLKMFPEFDSKAIDMTAKSPQRIPSVLHNAMLYPISKYTVQGVIWYQGENNILDYQSYKKMFLAMVKEWRDVINCGEIPFYYVQIAPYKYSGSNNTESAYLREVQLHCQNIIPNSGMVTTGDVGNESLVHPSNKKDVGKRLAYWALSRTYNFKELAHTSPIYKTKQIENNRILLTFDFTNGGLVLFGNTKQVFEIAGDDDIFYPAEVKIKENNSDVLVVWSEEIPKPKHVRYCFKNYYQSCLFSNYMIPASPFRTDTLSTR